jgi:hypothetical protein
MEKHAITTRKNGASLEYIRRFSPEFDVLLIIADALNRAMDDLWVLSLETGRPWYAGDATDPIFDRLAVTSDCLRDHDALGDLFRYTGSPRTLYIVDATRLGWIGKDGFAPRGMIDSNRTSFTWNSEGYLIVHGELDGNAMLDVSSAAWREIFSPLRRRPEVRVVDLV